MNDGGYIGDYQYFSRWNYQEQEYQSREIKDRRDYAPFGTSWNEIVGAKLGLKTDSAFECRQQPKIYGILNDAAKSWSIQEVPNRQKIEPEESQFH